MAVDLYSPAVLNRVVQDLKAELRPPFLLDNFFTESAISNSEKIYFDRITGSQRLAPFVSPLVEGQVVQSEGYQTFSFTPAYVKDKRVLEDGQVIRRPAGAPIAGPLDGMVVRQLALAASTEDQLAMLQRREEWMAAQLLLTGSVTVTGEKYPMVNVNFGRDPSLTVVLAGTACWNNSQPDPLGNLETWAGQIRDLSGAAAVDVVMSQGTWAAFSSVDSVRDLLGKYFNLSPRTNIDIGPDAQTLGFTDKGMVGDYHIWIYHDQYVGDDGNVYRYIPDGYLLLISRDIEGVRHYGMIKDEQAGFQARDYFQKSWTVPDPSVRFLMLQSAPLVVPYRPNACLSAKVY